MYSPCLYSFTLMEISVQDPETSGTTKHFFQRQEVNPETSVTSKIHSHKVLEEIFTLPRKITSSISDFLIHLSTTPRLNPVVVFPFSLLKNPDKYYILIVLDH